MLAPISNIQSNPRLREILMELQRERMRERFRINDQVNILIVTDSIIDLNEGTRNEQVGGGFGLGKVKTAIESNEFYNWINFKIVGASRDEVNYTQMQERGFTFQEFKFSYGTDEPYDLSKFDQVWLFGFWPGNIMPEETMDRSKDLIINQNGTYTYRYTVDNVEHSVDYLFNPLTNIEVEAITSFMSAGGGVLAMGDHHFVGATLCNNIPRVRQMRKWKIADQVPSMSGFDRKDTNQINVNRFGPRIPSEAQSDDVPQKIEVPGTVTYYFDRTIGRVVRSNNIHVIFSAKNGETIDVLPDHMHEGEVRGRIFGSTFYGEEWIGGLSEQLLILDDFPIPDSTSKRPVPEVIALGKPLNNRGHAKNQNPAKNPTNMNTSEAFGLVSVYNGDPLMLGRIVVDSTWHHWFNVNLNFTENQNYNGQVYTPNPEADEHYTKIRNYHKNVAIWLTPKEKRDRMILAVVWNSLIRQFDAMRFTVTDDLWTMGVNGTELLYKEASPALVKEWILDLLPGGLKEQFDVQNSITFKNVSGLPNDESKELKLGNMIDVPAGLLEIFVVGGIFKKIVPLVEKYKLNATHERKKINIQEISQSFVEGFGMGLDYFKEYADQALQNTSEQLATLKQSLHIEKKYTDFVIPHSSTKLSIAIETLVLNNPLINLLFEKDEVHFEAIVAASDIRVGKNAIRLPKEGKPAFRYIDQTSTLYLDLDQKVFDDYIEEGEVLKVEIYILAKKAKSREKIYEIEFVGDPLQWIGRTRSPLEKLANQTTYVDVWFEIKEYKK